MRTFRHILLVFSIWLLGVLNVSAQEDDKGFLTRTIQDALSGTDRVVSIDGFKGALSSTASFDQMTIADKNGVWLTLKEAKLVWNRSALLRGRLEVQSLTAKSLDIPRLAVAETTLPDAEAAPFSLPELPVSVSIEQFAVDRISLGSPLLGEAAQLSISASALYTDDKLDVDIQAKRTDDKVGNFAIKANFERSDNILDLLLQLNEGPEGIAARILGLPGQPAVDMSVKGSGPLDDLTTDVMIATDGQERLAGQITIGTQTPKRASDAPDRRILADIGGDITTLLAPRYRAFFGEDVRLTVDALLEDNGAVALNAFSLNAKAAELTGKVELNSDKWPTFIGITGRIASPDSTPIQLPLSGAATNVENVTLSVDYNASQGDELAATFDISALTADGVSIAETALTLNGTLQSNLGRVGRFLGDVTFVAKGLSFVDQPVAEAVGDAVRGKGQVDYVEGQPFQISGLSLAGEDYALTGEAIIDGFETGFSTLLDAVLETRDLSRFSAFAGRELHGQTRLALKGSVTPLSGQFDLAVQGSTQELRLGIAQADAVLAGLTQLNVTATRDETGTFLRELVLGNAAINLTGDASLRSADSQARVVAKLTDVALVMPQYQGPVTVQATATQGLRGWSIDSSVDGPHGIAISANGLATGPNAVLKFAADVPNVEPFVADMKGSLTAKGLVRQTPRGWAIKAEATGPYRAKAAITGMLTPMIDVSFDAAVPNVQPLVPQISGPVTAQGQLRQTVDGFVVDALADGPFAAKTTVAGLATGPDMRLNFDVSIPNVRSIAPGINGPFQATGEIRQTPDGIALRSETKGPYAARSSVEGIVTGPQAAIDFDAFLPDIGALVAQVNGPLKVTGNARKQGTAWRLVTQADGPSGTKAQLGGLVNGNGTVDIDLIGTAPLGLSRPFIAPRNLQGQARFDLSLNGLPKLSSVSGTIETSDATLSAPNLRLTLENIGANIRLGRNRADINVQAAGVDGGQLRVDGGIILTPALPADLQIGLSELVLIDPRLYRMSVNGALRLAGPLTGGAQISGEVAIGDTIINVPSTGLTSIGEIPRIKHVGERTGVIATRRKAGLSGANAGADPADNAGPGFGLNLSVIAPRRIYVRGRGLDAELGGDLRLTGNTNRIISAGRFELLRGRLDILGKRFDLAEGSIQFQGDLIPYLSFVSTTTTSTGDVSVTVEGPADAPEVSFSSTPPAPQDEVLAQLLFGRNLADISAFQALQLANAVATLAGKGGVGIISNLRDGFGLDDLDVTTTDSGATALRFGKYLTDNIYTDVTATSEGTGEVSLNIDLTPSLKGKATFGSDGNSGVGIFFEKDY